jgi:oligopeptide transport system ATP-binding protein
VIEPTPSTRAPIISVQNLVVKLPTRWGLSTIVDGVDFQIEGGSVFGIAGESGSGKTISMRALLGLLPQESVVTGKAIFDGKDLLTLGPVALQKLRGRALALVQQDPGTAFHPMLNIEQQLTDHTRYHLGLSRAAARSRALQLLRDVRIPDPSGALAAYPHQFSGGMLQRIAIAMAIACEPKVLIADEPTTGLDVTVQAGMLKLLDDLRRERDLTIVLITHDLGVLAALADTVAILYAGRVAETGTRAQVLNQTRHPYTRALLDALPKSESTQRKLTPIAGSAATAGARPPGCAFHARCRFAVRSCAIEVPPLVDAGAGHWHACAVDPFKHAT